MSKQSGTETGQEHPIFDESTRTAVDWWKGLNHNWKKTILANLDFSRKFGADHYSVYLMISSSRIYNAYYLMFNRRIRKRLDEFMVTEEALNEILNLKCLILDGCGLKNAYPLNRFQNLRVLSTFIFHNPEIFIQVPRMEKLKVLNIMGDSSLKGLSNWTSLEKIHCSVRGSSPLKREPDLYKNLVDVRIDTFNDFRPQNFLGKPVDRNFFDIY